LGELYRLNKVDFKLASEISGCIQEVFAQQSHNREEFVGLTSHLNLSDKLMVMESTFDRRFLSNSFFDRLSHEVQFELLKCCTPKTVKAGEYVYSHNQSSDKIFLIISGRVSCLLSGGVCFKTYVEGSYFGDLDSLNHMRRLFTVRAEEPLKLAVLDRDQLEQVLSSVYCEDQALHAYN